MHHSTNPTAEEMVKEEAVLNFKSEQWKVKEEQIKDEEMEDEIEQNYENINQSEPKHLETIVCNWFDRLDLSLAGKQYGTLVAPYQLPTCHETHSYMTL